MKNAYAKRLEFIKQGNPIESVIKLFINSNFGKTI